ncbi:uncharacterized protein G2W53_035097 [Senna tora]|uniref:Uncharacterized protein n=1 Tax=Senna tora TaxID=362788 RepID=A0A834W8X4_9FABA|nr:uncharacterized protein G2W53_035097 [Senna tora]
MWVLRHVQWTHHILRLVDLIHRCQHQVAHGMGTQAMGDADNNMFAMYVEYLMSSPTTPLQVLALFTQSVDLNENPSTLQDENYEITGQLSCAEDMVCIRFRMFKTLNRLLISPKDTAKHNKVLIHRESIAYELSQFPKANAMALCFARPAFL